MSEDYDPTADFGGSLDECYRAVRERIAAGGPQWVPQDITGVVASSKARGVPAMNRTPAQWALVKPDAFLAGSIVQARNVIEMMQQDIAALAADVERLSGYSACKRAEAGRGSPGGVE